MRRRSLLLAPLILLLGAAGAQAGPAARDRRAIQALVEYQARALDFSVALALAVAHAESNFDPLALSPKGARGVMQIMPATARSEYGIEPQLLWDPRVNVRLGIHFLRRLVASYGGRTDRALAHYNGGTAAAAVPLARTYPETRDYVRRVLRLEGGYRQEIGGHEAWMRPMPRPSFSRPGSARS